MTTPAFLELRNGYLIASPAVGAEIPSWCGPVPFLGSTETLLERMGFEIKGDYFCEDGHHAAAPTGRNPLVASPGKPKRYNPVDALTRAAEDVRDMRHRIAEDGPGGRRRGGNYKVRVLEEQRKKLQQQQKDGNGAGRTPQKQGRGSETSKDTDTDTNTNTNLAEAQKEVRDAWLRIARTYNSVRLVLFFLSDREGLDMFGRTAYARGEYSSAVGIKSLKKITQMLSETMTNLMIGPNASENDRQPRDTIRLWTSYANTWIMLRARSSYRDANPNSNFNSNSNSNSNGDDSYAIDLCDDSSEEGRGSGVGVCGGPPEGIPSEVSRWFLLWNDRIDRLMADLVSETITITKTKTSGTFPGRGQNEFVSPGWAGDKAARARARDLDARFSLLVGASRGKDQKLREQYLLSIDNLRAKLQERIRQGTYAKKYRDARLEVYGSCLSGLSLGKNADVDLSLTFDEAVADKSKFEKGVSSAKSYNRAVTDTVYQVKRKLEKKGPNGREVFCGLEAIPRARVPVIKGIYRDAKNPHSKDGSLPFDICLLNDIAVANSGLIKEYSDIDPRVKSLMIAVKRWTKDKQINSAPDNTLSSYTWMNLTIFYLQCIGFVPNLQCPSLMEKCNYFENQSKHARQKDNINNLDTAYLRWKGQAEKAWKRSQGLDEACSSVATLLYGFFWFYSREFPMHRHMVSIKRGGAASARLPKTMFPDRCSLHFCIEDPFETYGSHFPHDLGGHADEKGALYIMHCFGASEKYLGLILSGKAGDVEPRNLWPPGNQMEGFDRSVSTNGRDLAEQKRVVSLDVTSEESDEILVHDRVLEMLQPFAARAGSFIIGSTSAKKGTKVVVDFDALEPVIAVLAAHRQNPFELAGKKLHLDKKHIPEPKPSKKKKKKKNAAAAAGNNNNNNNNSSNNNSSNNNSSNNNSSNNNNNHRRNNPPPSKPPNSPRHVVPNRSPMNLYDPDKVIVIQNINGGISKPQLLRMIRPFAEENGFRVLSASVVMHGSLAFVDFDSVAAVHAVLAQHRYAPFWWNGMPLAIAQKSSPYADPRGPYGGGGGGGIDPRGPYGGGGGMW